MALDPAKPYNDLPLLPPKVELETRAVLKACVQARAALAELKQAGALIPDPAVLINTIPLLEAKSSSEIENVVTTTDRLFEYAERADAADPATKEALRYRTALREGFEDLKRRPLSTATAVRICRTIKGVDIDIRRTPGTALVNERTGQVIYTPPTGEKRLRDLLANWERFVHDDSDLDPLVRLAVQHYQFEAIHPFIDGNGRTGRVLNLLFLVDQGLLDLPVLYLSRAILRQRADYYRLLNAVRTDGAWEPWSLFMIAAVGETARWTTAKIAALRQVIDKTAAQVSREAPGLYTRELVELLFVQPYCRIGNLVDAGIAQRQTAAAYLQQLVALGLLKEVKRGREKVFINRPMLTLLTRESVQESMDDTAQRQGRGRHGASRTLAPRSKRG
jgi:Fic family protein